ncbi:OTU domain-containing protein 4 [Myripristis murdjan]|uniref:OTU domain-containing protein 4 n=1 Tax=Myripristis murdjan TaxID=586833 RepID=UPI001175EFE5|nr:OTU domain-containing protein 4 [Myripristis murdjan]
MEGSGGLQSSEEKGAEKCMDDYLKSIGLQRKKIAKDGSCLFRAVAEQVLHSQSLHTKVRAKCVEFLKHNRESYEAFVEGNFEEYLCKLQDPQHWVGEVEINALAVMYKRDFFIFQEPGKPAINITDKNFKDTVQLCFLNGNHYDSVYPISHVRSAAICQSILYELLYDRVFKVERSALSVCQRVPRSSDVPTDDTLPPCASSDESDAETGQPLWLEEGTSTTAPRHNGHNYRGRGRGRHLPERVKRSLNPALYRNVEYDVWTKSKRAQQKMDFCIAAGMQYTVGDRCQVRLDNSGRSYSATIKEVSPSNGPVMVYIEELGRKQSVSLWNLRPPGEESSWRTVNRDKRLSNGHGEWDERGRGRGRGKPPPASAPPSSVSQATAPGSAGRVQKQHSWPQQAAADEQGGARGSRCLKSVSMVEPSPFGLTEEERLAREEEERNVALVEMQLRDEHSFPALGTQPVSQGEGGKRKGGEKRRSLKNTNKSPVEEFTASSPPTGDGPSKSSTPPLATTAVTAITTNTAAAPAAVPPTAAANPASKPAAAPAANPDSPTWLSKLKAPTPNQNAAAASASPVKAAPALTAGSAPTPGMPTAVAPPTCTAPAAKVSAQSYASAAGGSPASPPPCAAKSNALSSESTSSGAPPLTVPSSAAVFSLVTPALPAAIASSPSLPAAASPSSLSSSAEPTAASRPSAPRPSSSPSPPSTVSPPTFIAPIAPSPVAAQGLMPHPSLPRASPPLSSSPASSTQIPSSTSFAVLRHDPPVCEAPAASVQPPDILHCSTGGVPSSSASHALQTQTFLAQAQASLPQASLPQASLPQASLPQASLPQASLPQASLPQLVPPQAQTQPSFAHLQPQYQSQTSLTQPQASVPQASVPQASLPQASLPQPQAALEAPLQASLPHLQPQPQQQSVQGPSSHPASGASYPQPPQASLPPSLTALVHPQPSVTQPQVQGHPVQPPHPSSLPHPSLSLSPSQTHPSVQTQTSSGQSQLEVQPQHPQHGAESPAHPASQQPHPPQSSQLPHHPHFQGAAPPPPHPLSVPGAVPLQQLSQLFQDPLYPGFPSDKDGVVPKPAYSLSQAGDDLPQDVGVLRFFYNLGVKAYTNPMYSPCVYLLPLQQAYAMHPKLQSCSPSPPPSSVSSSPYPPAAYPPANPPARPQESSFPPPPYPPASASMPAQYDHHGAQQASPAEAPRPAEPAFNQAGYPVNQPPPHRVSWQQHQVAPPRNPSYPVGYPTPPPSYTPPQPSSQGYPPAPAPGHPLYPAVHQYAPSSLGYPPSSAPAELPGGPGAAEQLQPASREPTPSPALSRGPAHMETAATNANMANANGGGAPPTVPPVFSLGLNREQGDASNRPVLLVDPPINNIPIWANVPPPGEARGADTRSYRGHKQPGAGPPITMTTPLSVGCSTEDDWEESERMQPERANHRGRKPRGGGRGRGSSFRRRPGGGGGDMVTGFHYNQFNPSHSHRGRGRERGY